MTVLRDYAAAVNQPTLTGDAPRYDEVAGPDGVLRPGWRALAAELDELTSEQLHRVDSEIRRFLADDGVTYGVPGSPARPWQLDPMPWVLTAEEWAPLDVGLTQRTELLNAILVDLYGERRLLSAGVLPPGVVFGHAGYLRSLVHSESAEARPLVVAAADLGRDAQGQWRVLADRTQAPSGIGFAMENRRIISRVMPRLYREAGLHRMAPFFQALRSALMQAAPEGIENPRVVVLTPGTHSETSYDQAFLASSLGFPLVQGADLTVRQGAVHMRVFDRLERVDVILRRVDALWSDPLELRGDSHLGVAGLTEAVRRGTVRVVNGLGSGILESPALMPFLPAASELLLGEPLRLASLDTWWLGDPEHYAHARAHASDLVVRAVDAPTWQHTLSFAEVDERQLWRYVAQERPTLSQSPVLAAGAVRPAPAVLRAFTVSYGGAYRPLVGGLARVVDGRDAISSKDVWVLKRAPEAPDQGLVDVLPLSTSRSSVGLVPRVLEDSFWFGRYAERAEDTLRLFLAAHAAAEDYRSRPNSSGGTSLGVLLDALHGLSPALGDGDLDADFRSILTDTGRPGSVAQSLVALREAAEGMRDRLSGDVWRAFGSIERSLAALGANPHSRQVAESAGRMLNSSLAVYGVTSNMMRDPAWHVIQAGRMIERALQVLRLLDGTVTRRRGIDVDREVHEAVLLTAESAVTHQMRYRGYLRPATVLDLLLADTENPRSLVWCVRELSRHLRELPSSTGSTRPERLLDSLWDEVRALDIATMVVIEGEGRPNLERRLDEFVVLLERVSEAMVETLFTTGPAQRSFGLGQRLVG